MPPHQKTRHLHGYGPRSALRQLGLEHRVTELTQAETLGSFLRALAARPHIAGTPAQAHTRDYVLDQMRTWGLATESAEYEVYLPHPTAVALERLTPAPHRFTLSEPGLAGLSDTGDPTNWPAWHGYAVAGEVSGALVYVNYAREADLDRLAEMGLDLAGKIAVARYGELFRGLKVLNVQRRGAIGCILFSDPFDDGYFRGDAYPLGSMRPPESLQRGSLNTGAGDPTAARSGVDRAARRCAAHDAPTLPRIPSLPVGFGVAEQLLRYLAGPEVPQEWQGALPLRYHIGPGPVAVRLKIEHDGRERPIWNTFGRIEGGERPEEQIIIGAHRDAWGCGAADNVGGVACVLEIARVCADLARAGQPPRRTMVFATWDAEEWGLIGSTEWVAQHRAALDARTIAYINLDVPAVGPDFHAVGSPALGDLLCDTARQIPSPDLADVSVFDAWRTARNSPPELGQPGGGSDHEAFFLHLGIPFLYPRFEGRWGNYHSAYDVCDWLERLGDPGYRRHAAIAALTALAALRLANAPGLPLDYVTYGRSLLQATVDLEDHVRKCDAFDEVSLTPLTEAAEVFRSAATDVRGAAGSASWDKLPAEQCETFNAALRSIERALTRPTPDGTVFHRNLVFGVDPKTLYGGWTLPGLRAAFEERDATRLRAEVDLLADRLSVAISHLLAAHRALRT